MATSQMNVRIDDALKAQGDAVFAELGLNPSEVVRAVWTYAAQHGDAPAVVTEALQTGADRSAEIEERHRLALVQQGHELVSSFRARMGMQAVERTEELDYRALREEAWEERLAEQGDS